MAKFDALLNQIHQSTQTGALAVDEDIYIKIDKNRQFVVPDDFNPIVAYEGDVNSQVITFTCPAVAEGHRLADCANKKLRWCNLASGNEGSSVLSYRLEKDTLYLSWEAPPEAFTAAGDLEISITFSDYDTQSRKVIYSWNTAPLLGLKVGKTLDKVSDSINNEELVKYCPAKNEVLLINTETRQITEPSGYNRIFCNYGDAGTSVVYFQIKRYVRGIDLLDENTKFKVYWKINDEIALDSGREEPDDFHKYLYAVEITDRDSEGLVNVIWLPSTHITANDVQYHGPITIILEFSNGNRIWRTSYYDKLEIGEHPFPTAISDLPGEDPSLIHYRINANLPVENMEVANVAGLVQHKRFTSSSPAILEYNQIGVEYEGEKYYGVKVGTSINGQWSDEAPYIAYSPEVTVVIHGGNASEE